MCCVSVCGGAMYWHVTVVEEEEEGVKQSKAKQSKAMNNKERVGEGLSVNYAYLHVIW